MSGQQKSEIKSLNGYPMRNLTSMQGRHNIYVCSISTSPIVTYRDKDGDGQLNFEELKNWLVPANYDPSNAEAVHLIHHADSDMVGRELPHKH